DRVVVRLESGGGMVHSYGLAAAQLARVRERGIPLTVCVDKVAASGGYLMACVAERVVAAPFAMLGSIGVVAQIPNFHRLLQKHDIDYEMVTAGQYKRTLTLFGHNTDAAREKFTEELEDTHALFKEFVSRYRPALDMQAVATGEAWFGERALALGLVDALGTSDALLQEAARASDVLEIRYVERKGLGERLGLTIEGAVERGVARAAEQLDGRGNWLR
nr:protease SohB [Pseudomonadales bacterium]